MIVEQKDLKLNQIFNVFLERLKIDQHELFGDHSLQSHAYFGNELKYRCCKHKLQIFNAGINLSISWTIQGFRSGA